MSVSCFIILCIGVVCLYCTRKSFLKALVVRNTHLEQLKKKAAQGAAQGSAQGSAQGATQGSTQVSTQGAAQVGEATQKRVYKYILKSCILGGVGLLCIMHVIYTFLKSINLVIPSVFDASDMLAALLAIVSIIVGILIFFVQEYNSELMEIDSAVATTKLHKYYQSVFELDVLHEQNKLRRDLAVECNSMYAGIILETLQDASTAMMYLGTDLTGFAKNFEFPPNVIYSTNATTSVENNNCKFDTANQKQFQLKADDARLFDALFTAISNKNVTTFELNLIDVKCKNFKVPIIDYTTDDLGRFKANDCEFDLKQKITVKYLCDNEKGQALFEILNVQSEILQFK